MNAILRFYVNNCPDRPGRPICFKMCSNDRDDHMETLTGTIETNPDESSCQKEVSGTPSKVPKKFLPKSTG